jgi:hypothetical protein
VRNKNPYIFNSVFIAMENFAAIGTAPRMGSLALRRQGLTASCASNPGSFDEVG